MTHLERSVATFRIRGGSINPEEISELLGGAPTRAWYGGDSIPSTGDHVQFKPLGQWSLRASDAEPENLGDQVAEILGKLTSDLVIWNDIATRFRIDLFCGLFMGTKNEGVGISTSTLMALAMRNIELSSAIYGPNA